MLSLAVLFSFLSFRCVPMLGIAVFRIRLYLAGKSVCAFDHGHECSQSLSAAPCAATPETCTAPPIECTVVAIDLVHFGAQPSIRKRARSGRLLTGRTVQRSVKIYSAPGDATPAGYGPLDRYGLTQWLLLSMAVSGWLTVCGRVALGFASRML